MTALAQKKVFAPAWVEPNLPAVAIRFTQYFRHPFAAILDRGTGWFSCKRPMDEGQIWEAYRDPSQVIGLGFGDRTRVAAIDIDFRSPHQNDEGLRKINWALEDIGINRTVLIRSSRSNGWHLYFAFPQPIPTFALACAIHRAMEEAGLTIAKGELELFPNRKKWDRDNPTQYNRLRLPLQAGSYLLGEDGLPYSSDLKVFLDHLDDSAANTDMEVLISACQDAKRNYNPSQQAASQPGEPCPFIPHNSNARKWKKSLEAAIAHGWDGPSQSNILMGQIAEYGRVFLGLGENGEGELAEYIHTTAIAAPGFIPHCRHRKEIYPWAIRWARSAIRHRYPYGTRKGGEFKPLGKGGLNNEEKKADAMGRVADVVAELNRQGTLPDGITPRMKVIASLAKCSYSTLSKPEYRLLWHPDQVDLEQCQNQDTARDTAKEIKPLHTLRNNLCSGIISSSVKKIIQFPSSTTPGSVLTSELPQTHTESKIQPFQVIVNVPRKLKTGDWVVEVDCPHRPLLLQSIDDVEGWCRCQDADSRRRGTRGQLSHLSELLPAPPELIQAAIAMEGTQ